MQEDDGVGGGGIGGTSGDTRALTVLSTDGAEVQRVRQGIWDTTGNSEDILKMTSTVCDVWMPFVDSLPPDVDTAAGETFDSGLAGAKDADFERLGLDFELRP